MQTKKYVHSTTDDFRNEQGLLVVSYNPEPYHKVWTRGGRLYHSLCQRLRAKTKNNIVYEGCVNNFESFQFFVDWCQHEFGYLNKESNGNFWSLDKDIIIGDKCYSPESCMFIPARVNVFFSYLKKSKGAFPIGVNFHKSSGKYVAQCNSGGSQKHLGLFLTPEEAHQAWQKAKLTELQAIIDDYSPLGHLKLNQALEIRLQEFENNIKFKTETTH